MNRIVIASLLFFALAWAGCEPEAAVVETPIEGRWELDRALRNNLKTEMLDGLYFEFGADSTLQTNLMGNTNVGLYAHDGEELITRGIIPELDYRISNLSDSTLNLRTQLQGFRFDFELVRPESPKVIK